MKVRGSGSARGRCAGLVSKEMHSMPGVTLHRSGTAVEGTSITPSNCALKCQVGLMVAQMLVVETPYVNKISVESSLLTVSSRQD